MPIKEDVKRVPPADPAETTDAKQGHPEVAGATALGAAAAGMAGAAIRTAIAGPAGGLVARAVWHTCRRAFAHALEQRLYAASECSCWSHVPQESPSAAKGPAHVVR